MERVSMQNRRVYINPHNNLLSLEVASFHAFIESFPVSLTVNKKFTLANQSIWTTKLYGRTDNHKIMLSKGKQVLTIQV